MKIFQQFVDQQRGPEDTFEESQHAEPIGILQGRAPLEKIAQQPKQDHQQNEGEDEHESAGNRDNDAAYCEGIHPTLHCQIGG